MSDSYSPFITGTQLLCLDYQPSLLAIIPERDHLLRRTTLLIAAAKALHIPIAFTEQAPQKLGSTEPALLALVDHPVLYEKTTFSALADDALRDSLHAQDRSHLLLCGIETPICVYQTALDALNSQFQVTVLTDATAGRRPTDSADALAELARHGVHLLPVETILYSILGTSTHPQFKTITQLVKKYA